MIAAHTLTRQGRGSLRFILGLRWVLLFTTPFMFGVSAFGSGRSTIWPILFIFGLSNLGLHLRNRAQPKGLSPWVWYATFAFDLLLVTMVVIQRGGIRTDAYLLYVLIVSEAGILVTKREAWVVGLVALAAYTGSVLWVNGPPELGRVFIRVVYLGMIALATNYLAAAEKRALTAALTDAKTNLPNARLFQEALTEAVAVHGRMGRPLAVAMIDVDNFRHLNATIGHPMADQVLERLAEILVAWTRPGELIARYGGEEFVILLPDHDLEGAANRLEALRARVEATPFAFAGLPPVQITISCGVTERSAAPTASALLLTADEALLAAKAAGKNQVASYVA